MDKFVVDAGPFIHLDQIGQLQLLQKLPQLLLPTSVLHEIGESHIKSALHNVHQWENVRMVSVEKRLIESFKTRFDRDILQQGEIDCIALALGIEGCILLTDDLKARVTAEGLGVEVHGSVGVIAYSAKRGWISIKTAESAFHSLYHQSNLFVTFAIIENAMQNLRKSISTEPPK